MDQRSAFFTRLNYCMLLLGPEATQLATYIGWLMHRTRGGFFVLPGFVAIMALSLLYALFFWGLIAAVLALVVEAVIRLGRALRGAQRWAIAGGAFAGIFFFFLFSWVCHSSSSLPRLD